MSQHPNILEHQYLHEAHIRSIWATIAQPNQMVALEGTVCICCFIIACYILSIFCYLCIFVFGMDFFFSCRGSEQEIAIIFLYYFIILNQLIFLEHFARLFYDRFEKVSFKNGTTAIIEANRVYLIHLSLWLNTHHMSWSPTPNDLLIHYIPTSLIHHLIIRQPQ